MKEMLGRIVAATCVTVALASCQRPVATTEPMHAHAPTVTSARVDRPVPPLVQDLERRTFDYFWERANPKNGLVPDRWPTPSFSSIAAVGFGLTAYGVGVERGYITRDQAIERTLATLRFFANAKQGPEAAGTAGYKGFFYHFLDMDTGTRYETNELSTVDTTLLMGGVLFAQTFYDRDDPREAEIRQLADQLYRGIDWTWAQRRSPRISMGWKPEDGFIAYDWNGYNEAILVYLLALGSPTHPVGRDAYDAWVSTYDHGWGSFNGGPEHLTFPPLFGHQYSHIWVDFRGITDDYMKQRGLDYFENSRRATLSQRQYAIDNPQGWAGYDKDVWGLTASDGPVDAVLDFKGKPHKFQTYTARGVGTQYTVDDGTLVPTAAASSIAFTPEESIAAIQAMHDRYGKAIYQQYGFLDAFNPSFTYTDVKLHHGKLVPGMGWVDGDYIGIDQGPIVLMIENHRSDFVWSVMRRNPYIRKGLERAGFTGGWLDEGK
ncbi:Tat pathway signal protein [Lysobacter sp. KIS68-7]|uniref:glucoamylase family protein n=1 Tax=Lysobacter sp. KIS68-7 TaxID=2904252 RepID=UPI001E46212A|nr:glucoamylase family protein [Lysobacter sp. KIS68-7]UHQ19157.1 Tat pathway signal protein [Lysobacter sp. KIS68-7]